MLAVERKNQKNPGVRIDAGRLGQVRGGQPTLQDVSLTVRPGELVAIIGSSGAGKTNLLEALAGVWPAQTGTVSYDGRVRDAGGPAGLLPTEIGYLPQDDIIHRELPLARTVRYAARLRLPADTTADELSSRVAEVLDELSLTDRAAVPVGWLSGGERKRASIAVELLTGPRVLFLDEPTSGLDPAIAAEFLRLLRRLADGGATVILTTHQLADVDTADQVVVLAKGGWLAYAGPPADAPGFFDVTTLAEIYPRLDSEPEPAVWADRFAQWSATGPAAVEPAEPAAAGEPAEPGRHLGRLRQCWVLTARNLDILRRNRLTLAILIGSPLMVLAMFVMLFRPGAFDPVDPSPSATVMILFWVAFGGFFFGLTYGLLQICTELPILRRERLTGVYIGPYLFAKVAVLLPLLAVVDAALLGVLRLLDRLPPLGPADLAVLYTTLLLSSACALALGLLCSAAVSDVAQATLMLPMLCFPQVLFVGAILPVPVMAAGGQWLSYAMSNRWAFEALGHTAGLPRLWAQGTSPLGPPLLASYGDSFDRPVGTNWLILAGFTVAFLFATWAVLARRVRRAG